VLILLMGVIYEVEMASGVTIYMHTKFHDDWIRHSSNITNITSIISVAAVLVLLMKGFYELCR
jgi:hypothetical protein